MGKHRGEQVSLREHFEALRAADNEAIKLSREYQTYKDLQANELRSQLAGERSEYLTRSEYIPQHQALVDRIDAISKTLTDRLDILNTNVTTLIASTQGGRSVSTELWTRTISVISALAAVAAVVVVVVIH